MKYYNIIFWRTIISTEYILQSISCVDYISSETVWYSLKTTYYYILHDAVVNLYIFIYTISVHIIHNKWQQNKYEYIIIRINI